MGKLLNFRSVKSKLVLVFLVILVVPGLIIGFSSYEEAKSQLGEGGKNELKNNVKMVIGMISLLNKDVEAGKLTKTEAQDKLRDELLGKMDSENKRPIKQDYTVGKNGYVFAISKDQYFVMHPTSEGTDMSTLKTKDGVALGKALLKAASSGGGFLTYMWPNPGTNKDEKKLLMPKWSQIGDGLFAPGNINRNLPPAAAGSFIF